jgi:hypothetical protein
MAMEGCILIHWNCSTFADASGAMTCTQRESNPEGIDKGAPSLIDFFVSSAILNSKRAVVIVREYYRAKNGGHDAVLIDPLGSS